MAPRIVLAVAGGVERHFTGLHASDTGADTADYCPFTGAEALMDHTEGQGVDGFTGSIFRLEQWHTAQLLVVK